MPNQLMGKNGSHRVMEDWYAMHGFKPSVPHCTGIACRGSLVAVGAAYMMCFRIYSGSNKEHLLAHYLQHNTDDGSAGTVCRKGT